MPLLHLLYRTLHHVSVSCSNLSSSFSIVFSLSRHQNQVHFSQDLTKPLNETLNPTLLRQLFWYAVCNTNIIPKYGPSFGYIEPE